MNSDSPTGTREIIRKRNMNNNEYVPFTFSDLSSITPSTNLQSSFHKSPMTTIRKTTESTTKAGEQSAPQIN